MAAGKARVIRAKVRRRAPRWTGSSTVNPSSLTLQVHSHSSSSLSSDDIPEDGPFTFAPDRDVYGDLVITEFVDEEVNKKYCDGYAIIIPAVDVRDVPSLKAKIVGKNQVQVVTVATHFGFRNHSNEWLGALETNKKKTHAGKLVKTLKSLVTRVKKGRSKHLKKYTISFPEEISNEYFSPGAPENVLTMVPLPYLFSHETTSKKTGKTTKFSSTEAVILWRVYIVDSERDIEEAEEEADDVMDQIGDFIGNL